MTDITDLDRAEAALRKVLANGGVALSQSAQQVILDAFDDARRWQALMNTARFRTQGSAGLETDGTRTPGAGYVHFGVEMWSHYRDAAGADVDNERGRNMFKSLVELTMMGPDAEAAIEAEKIDKKQRMDVFCLLLAKDIRAIVRVLPQVGLYEAIALSGRPELDPTRTVEYLKSKGLIDKDAEVIDKIALNARGWEVRGYLLKEFDEANAEM